MAITARDQHGTYTKARRAGRGPKLDRRTVRYFAVVDGVWSKGYVTRSEAQAAETDMRTRRKGGVRLDKGRLTVAEFIDAVWWPMIESKVAMHRLKQTTADAYRIQLDTHIAPGVGARKLKDVEPRHLRKLYADLKRDRGLSPKSLHNLHVLVSNIFKVAEGDRYIARNPAKAEGVRPGERGDRSPEQRAFTPEQVKQFLSTAADDRLFAAWRLAALTGMRRGELLGLQWRDIDLDAGRVNIERTWVKQPKGGVVIETPKSRAGKRSVTIDAKTVASLKAHRARQAEERLLAGELWRDGDEFVFTDELGRPLHPVTFSKRFARIVKNAGLERVKLHELRHTAITLSLKAGEDVHVAAARFGHAPEVMLSTYAHVLEDQRDAAAERIAAVFDN